MEFQEHSHQHCDCTIHDEGGLDNEVLLHNILVVLLLRVVVNIKRPKNALEERVSHRCNIEVCDHKHVDQQQDEKLAVPEPDAVIDPWAVVVHVQDASIASGAVMAALGLEDVAHETIAAALILGVTQMEAPEDRHLTGVCRHCLEK